VTPAPAPLQALADELARGALEQRPRLVELVLSLAALDAPSAAGAEALAPAAEQLARELGAMAGGRLTRDPGPQGELLELELGPGGGPHVLVLGHYDTVWPAGTAARRPAREDGGVISGPGVFDMRGGIAAALTALRLLGAERLACRTVVLLTPDEETGSAGSLRRIDELGRGARCVLVLEPPLPGGRLKTARSGWAAYRLTAHGRSAHAGIEPERGVNAIDELCDALVAARALADPERGTTINVGVIGGGTLPNIVAAEAHALLDLRVRSAAEQQRVDRALAALAPRRAGAELTLERLHVRPAMERTPAIAAAFEHARTIAALLSLDLGEGSVGGTSDANLLAHHGVAVLDGLGPDGGGAHAEDEHIVVDSLVQRAALIALLLAAPPG
jgi:glutamate carboxypeptidase